MNDLYEMVAQQQAEALLCRRAQEYFVELQESWGWSKIGSTRDTRTTPEVPIINRLTNRSSSRYSTIRDRQDGRFLPYYDTEFDLRENRQAARNLAGFSSIAIGAVETLDTFVVGTGYTMNAAARKAEEQTALQPVIDDVQQLIDAFWEQNKFSDYLESELNKRLMEDGEIICRVVPQTGYVARVIVNECDELTRPHLETQINRYLGCDDGRSHWEFGIHTRHNEELGKHDTATPLHYHFVYDQAGYEYKLEEAANVVHIKRNVPLSAKRGVSDFHAMLGDLEDEAKITRRLAHGMSILASIPFIRQYPQEQRGSVAPGANRSIFNLPQIGGGTRSTAVQRFNPGTIPEVRGGEYKPGPLAGSSAVPVMDTIKWLVQRMGAFWTIPSFMLTGDTETALYSAVLAIGTPFVKRRQKEQNQFGNTLKQMVWIALRHAYEHGALRQHFGSFAEMQRMIDINFTAPRITLASESEQAQTQATEISAGTLSKTTAAGEVGRDAEEEAVNITAENDTTDSTTLDNTEGDEIDAAFEEARHDPVLAAHRLQEQWRQYP